MNIQEKVTLVTFIRHLNILSYSVLEAFKKENKKITPML